MVSNACKQQTPHRKQQANKKQGKTQQARYRMPCIKQANPASKANPCSKATKTANPAPRQGKPKNDRQSLPLVSDTKKAKQTQQD
jgi:hypothetical protein